MSGLVADLADELLEHVFERDDAVGAVSVADDARKVGAALLPSIPSPLVAPDPALILRRADVGTQSTNRVLAVSIKQAFADHGAVQD